MKKIISYFEERRLIARFQQGDKKAFDILYQTYAPRVLAFSLTLVQGCRADAEDLTQETFVAAFQGASNFHGNARVLTWLLGITHRRYRDSTRRQHPFLLSLSEEQDSLSRTGASLEEDVIDDIRYQQALARLDEPQRVAFVLVASQGLTHKEAAHLLQTPAATIKWRVAQATKQLRALLTESDNEKDYQVKEAISCAQ